MGVRHLMVVDRNYHLHGLITRWVEQKNYCSVQSTLRITTLKAGHQNSAVIREVSLYPKYHYNYVHSYLVYPGSPGPDTARNFEMSVTLNHIHFDWEKAIDMAYDVNISTKSDKRVVIFPLKLAQIVPGRPKCP